jgi:hypothetical protein
MSADNFLGASYQQVQKSVLGKSLIASKKVTFFNEARLV